MKLPETKMVHVTEDRSVKLWCADCLAILPRLPAVDLLFADPPFNFGVDYAEDGGAADKKPREQYLRWTKQWVTLAAKALRPGGSIFIHVPDSVAGYIYAWLEQAGLIAVNWIILHQEFGQYCESKFITSKVHLLYFVSPPYKARTWNVEEVLEPSARLATYNDKRVETARFKGKRPFLDLWTGPFLGRVQGNNEERCKGHENQLPEFYLSRVIRAASKPGDLVFDPFCGSGTTLTVAGALDRNAWGTELQSKLALSAWKRILRGPVRNVAGPLAVDNKFST